jgi:hypothetical protein
VHTLALRAEDSFDNQVDTLDAWTWTVDLSGPLSAVGGPPTLSSSPNASITFTCSSNAVDKSLPDCETYQYVVTKAGSKCPEGQGSLAAVGGSAVLSLSDLTDGDYTVLATATDLVGNVQLLAAVHSWTVKLPVVLMSVNITSGPPEAYARPSAVLQFYAKLEESRMSMGMHFEVKLNQQAWSTPDVQCTAQGLCSYSLPTTTRMVYTLQVRCLL